VNETREEAKAAKSDVDERVGRAEAALDPYCKLSATGIFRMRGPCCTDGCAGRVEKGGCSLRPSLTSDGREKDGQEAQEDVATTHDVRLKCFLRDE